MCCRLTIEIMSAEWPSVHHEMLTDCRRICTSCRLHNIQFGPLVQIQQVVNTDSWIWFTNRIGISDGLWPAVYRWMSAYPAGVHKAPRSATVSAKRHAGWFLSIYREPKTQLQRSKFPGFSAHPLDQRTIPLILEVYQNDSVHATCMYGLWFWNSKMNTYIASRMCL
jgi:hypothetical protein